MKIGMTCAILQMFGNDPLKMESLISWERGKEIIFLGIFIILLGMLSGPTPFLDLRLCIKSLISSGVVGICKRFLSRRDFLLNVCKEIVEIFCYFNWASDSIIVSNYGRYITTLFVFSGRYDFMYILPYCFEIFFIIVKMMLIVSLFTLPY